MCEVMPFVVREFDTLGVFIDKIKADLGMSESERIYVGSYFCSLNFLHTFPKCSNWLFDYCEAKGIAVTLVVPTVTQKDFKTVCEVLLKLMDEFGTVIDEISVNDYGFLVWCSKNLDIKLNLGRLFFKALRDNRYHDMAEEPFVYTLNDYTCELLKKYNVCGVELDNIRSDMRIEENVRINAAIHYPYCYMSTGMVCEFASISRAIEEKFRPNAMCGAECCDIYSYCKFDCGDSVLKFGRTLYYRQTHQNVSIPNARMIFTPFDLYVESSVWGEKV